jgi:hypothetical protein
VNLYIDHEGVRREIDGPFNVSGAPEDLVVFAVAILQGLRRYGGADRAWCSIKGGEVLADRPPLKWADSNGPQA